MATNGVRSHVWKINCTNEQPNEVVVIGDAESSLENFTVHDFYGKKSNETENDPWKTLLYMAVMEKSNETENEF